jgi:hypothetical protein
MTKEVCKNLLRWRRPRVLRLKKASRREERVLSACKLHVGVEGPAESDGACLIDCASLCHDASIS